MFLDDSYDVFSQKFDDLEGLVVFLQFFDEHGVSDTSSFGEFNSLSGQVNSSLSEVDEVLPGSVDIVVDGLFVGITIISVFFVLLSDGTEIGDLFAQFLLLGSVDLVSSFLRIDVGLFQVSQ